MVRPEPTIREVQADDSDAVWQLHNRALERTGAHAGSGEWDADVRDAIGSYLNRGGSFLVCEIAGVIIGMGAFLPAGEGAVEIKRMRVDPAHQSSGIGWRILSALEQEARDRGFTRAILETTRQQQPARRLYERNGYVRVSESRLGRFEILHYEKNL